MRSSEQRKLVLLSAYTRLDLAGLTVVVLLELLDFDVAPVLEGNLLSLGETVGVTTLQKSDGREPHRALSDLRALQCKTTKQDNHRVS